MGCLSVHFNLCGNSWECLYVNCDIRCANFSFDLSKSILSWIMFYKFAKCFNTPSDRIISKSPGDRGGRNHCLHWGSIDQVCALQDFEQFRYQIPDRKQWLPNSHSLTVQNYLPMASVNVICQRQMISDGWVTVIILKCWDQWLINPEPV